MASRPGITFDSLQVFAGENISLNDPRHIVPHAKAAARKAKNQEKAGE